LKPSCANGLLLKTLANINAGSRKQSSEAMVLKTGNIAFSGRLSAFGTSIKGHMHYLLPIKATRNGA
jgi:hypothetical protein